MDLEKKNNFFFIGANLRIELPLLNLRFRKNYIEKQNMNSYSFGLALNYLTFPVRNLGNSIKTILAFIEGKFYLNFIIFFYDFFNINYFNYTNIIKIYFFIGMSVLNRIDSNSILFFFFNLFKELKYFDSLNLNILSKFLGRISMFEIGSLSSIRSNMLNNKMVNNFININHFCGVDLDVNKIYNLNSTVDINIYQGTFYINEFMKYI
jgi:hypothetical protein